MRIKAAVMYEVGQPLVVEAVELDPPKANEVLVRIVASGVCHSDVHYFTGDLPRDTPVVLGHEGAGVVEAVGAGVTRVQPGDHAVLTFLPACGKCRWCHQGQPTLCEVGAQVEKGRMLDGTSRLHRAADGVDIRNLLLVSSFAEYSVVPENSVLRVEKHLPLERLCLLGCGFSTGFGAATRAAHIRPGETVTIIGCGGLGLAAVQGARLSGAGKIICVDVHEQKLDLARKFGATHTIQYRRDIEAVIQEVMDITWGVGTDFSMEFVGADQTDETVAMAYGACRKGGTILMVGVGQASKKTIPLNPVDFSLYRKHLQGVLFGDTQFLSDIPAFIDLYEKKQIDLDGMVSQEFRLEDVNTCLNNLLDGTKVARQVIRF